MSELPPQGFNGGSACRFLEYRGTSPVRRRSRKNAPLPRTTVRSLAKSRCGFFWGGAFV